ncbi:MULTISPECIES: REP-associated tyrosine transposase [Pontibacillus]|uniref:Transposase n=1 Tax=Pontibacillus chungwhensis TaxID=265426 RepID=A0ABY8UZ40_9BACI|nr:MULTISPECIES: transposase [Pontibacillus]MCD5324286.1 transposase [Pontibacillus sp. HN14]WIF97660.1 transposase [Pontibacillus chungwhensis]
MGRNNRSWFPGGMYHITARGNRKQEIFRDERDLKKYMQYVTAARQVYPFHLYAYCLMGNHVHLLIEMIDDSPSVIMKSIQSRYARYFNNRHDVSGHLFQGRYGAEFIDSIFYFLFCSRYIHMNPVEANLVRSPEDYRWSSYNAYVTRSNPYHINTSKTLQYFNTPHLTYRQYVTQEKYKAPL